MIPAPARFRPFLPLMGALIAASLAGWRATHLPDFLASVILIGALLLTLLVLVGVSISSVQKLRLPWMLQVVVLIVVAVLVQIALGVPITLLGLFLVFGIVAGLLSSPLRVPPSGMLIALVIALLLVARQQSALTLADVVQISTISYVVIFVLCCVAPVQEHAVGWDSADTLLFLSVLVVAVGNQPEAAEHFSPWLWVSAGALALIVVAMRRLISNTLLEHVIWPRFQQLFILRILDLALEQPTKQYIGWLELITTAVTAPVREQILQRAITPERRPLWQLWSAGVSQTSALGQGIGQAMQAALETPAQQEIITEWLEAGLWDPERQIWQRCLDLLQISDPQLALRLCWDVLQAGRVAPFWQCARQLEPASYRMAMLDLLKFARAHPEIEIADFLENQIRYYLDHMFSTVIPSATEHISTERLAILIITLFGLDADRIRKIIVSQPHETLSILFDGLFIESTLQAYQKRVIHILTQEAKSDSFLLVNACFQTLEHIILIAPAWSQQAFAVLGQGIVSVHQDIQKEALNSIARLIAQQQPIQSLARPKLLRLGLSSPAVQSEAKHVLINTIGSGQAHIWPVCLNRLITLDRTAAYRACLLRLRLQHDPEPWVLALKSMSDQEYLGIILGLAALHAGLPAAARHRITAHLRMHAIAAPTKRAAGAVLGLAIYHPALLPELLLKTHQRQLIAILLEFGNQPALRRLAIQALCQGLGCQITPAAQQPLAEAFFPFGLPPTLPEARLYAVEEALAAPAQLVGGSPMTLWTYAPTQHQLSDIVLIGQGNPAEYKRAITSLLHYILEHGDPQGNDWMLLIGVCRLQIHHPSAAQALLAQLHELAQRTGMLDHQHVESAHDRLCHQVHAQVQAAWSSAPAALRHWVDAHAAQAVVLPIGLSCADQQADHLAFDLPLRLFGVEQAIQQANLRNAMQELLISDAGSRLLVYKEWLRFDQAALADRLDQLVREIAGDCPSHMRSAVVARWQQQLMTITSEAQQPQETLVQAAEYLRLALQQQGIVVPDQQWRVWLAAQQRHVIHTSGGRDYPNATLSTQLAHDQMSSPLALAVALPVLITEDRRWIAQAEVGLSFDQERQRKLKLATTRFLYDAFLRGCPPELLCEAEQQAAYRAWCRDHREVVWRAIHADLCRRGLRIDPLLAGNVVFDVREIAGGLLRITPRFIADANRLLALILPHAGMIQYIEAWDYRHVQALPAGDAASKAHACQAACSAAYSAIAANQPEVAIQAFRRALQIQPVLASNLLLSAAWRETRRDTQRELAARRLLACAVDRLQRSQQLPQTELIQSFIDEYPGFLADPYLLRMILEQPASESLRRSIEQIRMVRASQQEPIDPAFWQSIDQLVEQLLQTIGQIAYAHGGRDLELARLLDPVCVAQLQGNGIYQPSQRFLRHITPFIALERADAYQRIASDLTAALAQQLPLAQLRQRLATHLSDQWLLPEMTQTLLELYQQLAAAPDDADPRYEQQRRNVQIVIQHLVQQTFERIRTAAQVAEISEPSIRLSKQLRMNMAYHSAFLLLLPRNTQPLANYPGIQWTIEDSGFYQVRAIRVEPQPPAYAITILTPTGEKKVLSITGLTASTAEHLQQQLSRSELVTLLSEDKPTLAPAYALLLAPLAISPQIACWQTVLDRLRPALLALLALHDSVPITPLTTEQAQDPAYMQIIDRYTTSAVVCAVRYGPDELLSSIDTRGLAIPQSWQKLELLSEAES